jgi:chromosome segregation protein
MRLSKIRLTGFKSFVDATPVPFPGGITVIVGPNGCGKSNIIDAVRWVMGESSAKHLRGGSMADVIFSGSGNRKPVGQASIELFFDNSDGSLGGQYAGFAEISVRRQVNRDGQSAYYLNGTRCRRRDITDVFLGTGLGPRSYSIIEQGTISRLIEAKPEELRAYLEEAAGISLYKERRRETERRMRDTHENLERLEDVRDEVGRQLEKLAKQAETAEQYRELKKQERQRRAELFLIKINAMQAERQSLQQTLGERETALEARLADQRGCEREMEALRARHAEESDQLNEIQGRYYQLGSDIARIEQRISHRDELRASSQRELEGNREALAEAQQALAADRDKEQLLRSRVTTLKPELEVIDRRLAEAETGVETAQARVDEAREALDAHTEARNQAEGNAEIERARIEQLEERQFDQHRRRERIDEALGALVDEADDDADMTREVAALRQQHEAVGTRLETTESALADQRQARDEAQGRLTSARNQLAEEKARRTSLQTLQDAALGADEALERWLEAAGVNVHKRLAEQLRVEPGWEAAVEAVLGDALQAVAAGDPLALADHAEAPGQGRVMLYRGDDEAGDKHPAGDAAGRPLQTLVQGPAALRDLLAHVHAASDVAAARAMLAALPAGESVVTPDGRWLGHQWMRMLAVDDSAEAGVIARAGALEASAARIDELETAVTAAEADCEQAEDRLAELDESRESQMAERSDLQRRIAALEARIESAQAQHKARAKRRDDLQAERDDLVEAMEQGATSIREARERLQAALDEVEAADAQREPLEQRLQTAREALHASREQGVETRQSRQDLALRIESAQTALQSVEEAITRSQRQTERLESRNQTLEESLAEIADPDDSLEQERQALLERRVSVESELTAARQKLQAMDAALRELDQKRVAAETAVAELREQAESARYQDHEIEVRIRTQQEQLDGMAVDAAELAAGLPADASEVDWQKALTRLDERIRRLGPINLAAIDEHQALSERKSYLDRQHADLSEALETLQDAIQRIDRETRARFKATFDKVNAGLQRLFPRLFGGGQAYLEMTDDDLLETGVTIMARPPGKRISNIHLLSGGEKALAAVSLVFAIFELNPAPFCMLDEVDAPLDEANVGRFCDLLKEMSGRVQFIVITHNKATMEAASHLAGVTMAEPGVSRLVAVDMASAVELAEADA